MTTLGLERVDEHDRRARPPRATTEGLSSGTIDLDTSSSGPQGTGPDPTDDAIPLPVPRPRPNGSILMAAMLGLAQALGFEPREEQTEMVQPAEPLRDGLELDFGSLPPLDQ